ncbi:MAG TPA: hypothetical protein VGB64_09995 [Actinomycetota bacterium]
MRIPAFRIIVAVALLAGFAVPGSGSAVPVPGGSSNVELIAQFPDIQAMGGRFIGRYLYTTATDGLRVYDTANPLQPVPVATLPLPSFSNEDVSVSNTRKLVLLSSDWGGLGFGGGLFVVDVVNPALPRLIGVLPYNSIANPDGSSFDRVGHIANCLNDCARYAWITGADKGRMLVVDLQNPAAPRAAGWVTPQANPGNATVGSKIVHDVTTDSFGDVWVFGSQGISKVDASNPLAPVEKYSISKADNDRLDQLVMHNGMRLDARTLVVTEEDWIQPQCKAGDEGSLQTWEIPTTATGTLKPLDQWTTEMGTFLDGGTPVSVACSAHWFDLNAHGVAAVGWYHQGIRFLDVSKPGAIRQVGYYIPPWEVAGAGVSMALYVPGRSDLVYGMSLSSGLIVLRIANGGAGAGTVVAPILAQWIGARTTVDFEPHPTFGWACPVPTA